MTVPFGTRSKETCHIRLFNYKYILNPYLFHLTGAGHNERVLYACLQSPRLPRGAILGQFTDCAAFEHTTFLNNTGAPPLSAEVSVCELVSHPPWPKWEHLFCISRLEPRAAFRV